MARADHIYVSRGPYTHHGIDAGDGTVIHFTGEPGAAKINASIARTSMVDFLKGGDLKTRRYGARDDVDTTMARAEGRLGETGYHLVINNCEHFATWCCTGRSSSEQVRGAGSLTAHGAVAGTTVAATTGVVGALGAVGGMSGAGIMSGLATAGGVAGGGAAIGPAMIGLGPAVVSVGITQVALRDDETLPDEERRARRDGRAASLVGAGASTIGGVAAISAAGTTGLSAAGISSGLATIGGLAGGGMAAGTVAVVAAPAVAAAGLGAGVFMLSRRLRRRTHQAEVNDENTPAGAGGQ
ncbi:lecithin retinol acyltransferase family protein [Nocardioides sp. HDW12B]|uniref:lecithin retinol acyltransferase family protein n=1 Tax=Nocardioides sp. HDW12B TaxID=2714939 RepID=UPI00140780C3|nr:lecithin retinol acyltransferase family protein [Nocardioides sp. HDW12B]QIK66283.1 lecithin retinol acyltransferase family protein [Nocardioides sp. HDW12B]